jgi:hypothetical protein
MNQNFERQSEHYLEVVMRRLRDFIGYAGTKAKSMMNRKKHT